MVEVIAEIGVNHHNDIAVAGRLIEAAKWAGANTVKFQHSRVDREVSKRYAPEHYAMIAGLVPSLPFLAQCKTYAEGMGLRFLCTPSDPLALNDLVGIGVDRLKIGSDNLNNPFVLRAAAATRLDVILSTGMSDASLIVVARSYFPDYSQRLTLLHCCSAYPAPTNEANLGAIPVMRAAFGNNIGWSDHTPSVTLAVAAVALGAVVIEKHITMSRNDDGPDHKSSLEPREFAAMVDAIREVEVAMGTAKTFMSSEREMLKVARKSLMAATPIKAGEQFTSVNVEALRPATAGRSPMDWPSIAGRLAQRDYEEGEAILI